MRFPLRKTVRSGRSFLPIRAAIEAWDIEGHMILNAFSLNMLALVPARISVSEITVEQAAILAGEMTSAVGHADTAAVFSAVLGTTVPTNRATVSLSQGTTVLVGQYRGPRLPEGATALPEGATIQWLLVTVE